MIFQKFHEIFPEKTHRVNSNDQPWISHKLKSMDKRRKQEFNKHRMSEKWKRLNQVFKENVKCAKKTFYKKMMNDLMNKNTSQWYSSVKRMTSYNQQKSEKVIVHEINHLSDEDQAKQIADNFTKISNEYEQIKLEDIDISPINKQDIPQFKSVEVWMMLS